MLKELLKDEIPQGRFWNKAWSLVENCSPVSPGCRLCWLASMAKRFSPEQINPETGHFNGNVICREDRLEKPLHARKPCVYAIWSDLFHEAVPVDFLNRAFSTMNTAKQHEFIIITKRPNRASEYLRSWPIWCPMPNVTILVTMEDQQRANERCPSALQMASLGWRVGALCEPLLGPINMQQGIFGEPSGFRGTALKPLSWIITGGETGHNARPANPDWFRSIRDQAQAAGVPFLLKSLGEYGPGSLNMGTGQPVYRQFQSKLQWVHKGNTWVNGGICLDADGKRIKCGGDFNDAVYPVTVLHRLGKKKSGRILDGKEWSGIP